MQAFSTLARRIFLAALFLTAAVQAQELRQITIATSSASIPAGAARIAKEMGLYEKHGLQAKVTPMETGSVATPALVSGAIDFATSGPSDVVMAQSRGQKLVVLTSGYRGFAASVVLSKTAAEKAGVSPNAPIAQRLKALDGLRIASTSSGSTFTVAVKTAAESVGAKANFVYMAQPAMIAAFRRGLIDGMTVSAPYYIAPIAEGLGYIWISGPKGEFPSKNSPVNSSVLITRRDFAEANPDLMKRVTAVFEDLWKAFDERPAEVRAAMAKLWPEVDAKTLDAVLQAEAPAFKAKPVTAADMAHDIAFMKLGGVPLPQGDQLNPAAMLFP